MKAKKKTARVERLARREILRLPDLDQAKAAVIGSLPSKESQRGYRHAIDEFINWYCSEPRLSFNRAVVTRYRTHLESRQSDHIEGRAGSRATCGSVGLWTAPQGSCRASDISHSKKRGTLGDSRPGGQGQTCAKSSCAIVG